MLCRNRLSHKLLRLRPWRKLLETAEFATVEEIAVAEKINPAYVGRVMRLTLLAPEIVEHILDGRQPNDLALAVLMRPFAVVARGRKAVGLLRGRMSSRSTVELV